MAKASVLAGVAIGIAIGASASAFLSWLPTLSEVQTRQFKSQVTFASSDFDEAELDAREKDILPRLGGKLDLLLSERSGNVTKQMSKGEVQFLLLTMKHLTGNQIEPVAEEMHTINKADNSNCPPGSDKDEYEKSLLDIYGARVGGKLTAMGKMNACLSFKQLSKFSSVKDKVMAWIRSHPEKNLLAAYLPNRKFYAIEVNDDYAYLHIWKNGGTTVNAVTKRNHTKAADLGGRTLFTTVRDPIGHFLSGWAECGFRSENPKDPSFTNDTGINENIASWLDKLEGSVASPKPKGACLGHSLPQANFMLDPHNENFISPKLGIIGDLHELSAMLEIVGVTGTPKKIARSASDNHIKVDRFPNDISLLSNLTVQRICKFVIVDYLFFDFEPPSTCREIVQSYVEMVWHFEIKSFPQHQ